MDLSHLTLELPAKTCNLRKDGRIEMKGSRERRRKQLLYGLKKTRRYCNLEKEALDRTVWRIRLGKSTDLS